MCESSHSPSLNGADADDSIGIPTLADRTAATTQPLWRAGATDANDGDGGPNLLLTDVIVPGSMNGRQLAEEVVRRRSGLKVLFTSGYTEYALLDHGRLPPGVLLLAKPARKSELRMVRPPLLAQNESSAW